MSSLRRWSDNKIVHTLWRCVLVSAALMAVPANSFAQEDWPQPFKENAFTKALSEVISFQFTVEPTEVKPGQTITATITGEPTKLGWHTYPVKKLAPKQIQYSKVAFELPKGLKALPPFRESEPEEGTGAEGEKVLQFSGPFTWSQDIVVMPDAQPGEYTVTARIWLQVCEQTCIGPADFYPLEAKIKVVAADGQVTLSEEIQKRLKEAEQVKSSLPENSDNGKTTQPKDQTGKTPQEVATNQTEGGRSANRDYSLWGLLVSAAVGAFLMLLTPCVFPMIPITVNFFIKQSEKKHHNPLTSAMVYSGTIILLLTAIVLIFGKLVIALADAAWFNLLLGGVLIFFALSLFGMYEIELPSSLTRFTSAREGSGGQLGTMFMALTFTITSFTCTGPFLGVLLAPVAGLRPPVWHIAIAAVVYSAVFAAPFFFLALFPTLLKKLPSSGGWMNAIKVTMGFLELGAALKFLANWDIGWNPGAPWIFNYDTVLCAWIALALACGLYLMGVFRLPHDEDTGRIGVARMLFASIFLGLAVYLTPMLFGIKPEGIIADGVVAFLPPQFRQQTAGVGGSASELAWTKDYEEAWKVATKENKLIFIDFTGVVCTNCRYNEKNVFPVRRVHELLSQYSRLQLYTDTVPQVGLSASDAKSQADRNLEWQTALVSDVARPTYVVFRPDPKEPFTKDGLPNGTVLGKVTGQINDVEGFVKFLEMPLQQTQIALRKNGEKNAPDATEKIRQAALH